jgi:hypothetical protein
MHLLLCCICRAIQGGNSFFSIDIRSCFQIMSHCGSLKILHISLSFPSHGCTPSTVGAHSEPFLSASDDMESSTYCFSKHLPKIMKSIFKVVTLFCFSRRMNHRPLLISKISSLLLVLAWVLMVYLYLSVSVVIYYFFPLLIVSTLSLRTC